MLNVMLLLPPHGERGQWIVVAQKRRILTGWCVGGFGTENGWPADGLVRTVRGESGTLVMLGSVVDDQYPVLLLAGRGGDECYALGPFDETYLL